MKLIINNISAIVEEMKVKIGKIQKNKRKWKREEIRRKKEERRYANQNTINSTWK